MTAMVTRSNSQGSHNMPTPSAACCKNASSISGSRGGLLRCLRFCRLRNNNGFKDLSDKLAKAFCFKCRSTCRVSSSSAGGSRSPFVVSHLDVHRKEAIKDCIEFINHSSSLPRSNSVSA